MAEVFIHALPPLAGVGPAHVRLRAAHELDAVEINIRATDPEATLEILHRVALAAEAHLAELAK